MFKQIVALFISICTIFMVNIPHSYISAKETNNSFVQEQDIKPFTDLALKEIKEKFGIDVPKNYTVIMYKSLESNGITYEGNIRFTSPNWEKASSSKFNSETACQYSVIFKHIDLYKKTACIYGADVQILTPRSSLNFKDPVFTPCEEILMDQKAFEFAQKYKFNVTDIKSKEIYLNNYLENKEGYMIHFNTTDNVPCSIIVTRNGEIFGYYRVEIKG